MNHSAQVVLITDADTPVGRALIRHFSAGGAHLVLNSGSGGAVAAVEIAAARAAGSSVIVKSLDLSIGANAGQLVETAEELGGLDVLVHNNDLLAPATVETCAETLFHEVMNANAKSAFLCAQAAGKAMAPRQSGCIVFVSSIHAEKPTGSSFAYSASKGAVKMLAKEAALELGRHGIRVNTIETGPVEGDDERFRSPLTTLYHSYETKVPRGQLGSAEDIAHAAGYLASAEARYLNGADLRLDGGFLLHYMDHKMKRPKGGDSP
ncbi:SDR family NAD(P)-dependent oxidoreductase [Paenibacillus sp. XY044]|uniref:SDR family NAD(P)-dependent oxidoreductase n=1 Tax=Paenibacillus sp. XY044 TaxID=2026089 RepID=UPI000B998501|nr:SDR family oxidoreductase [Paenibacillus sp. XY044]OZB90823.1 short-chain dehydrogenase [Paenibacillus sp. XY044]